MSYYSEEIEKDTCYHKNYLDGIGEFLQNARTSSDLIRKDFLTPEKYIEDPEKFRNKLKEILGFPLIKENAIPVLKEKKFVIRDGNIYMYRTVFTFFGYLNFYGLFFEQVENSQSKPFIIGIHGGEGTPELISSIHLDSANYNHLVRRLTDKGANVFVPQLLLWSTEKYGTDYDRKIIDGKFRQLGGSITAFELMLLSGCIDFFIQEGLIEKDKIGVAGLSYGGMYAIHLAAIDTRIKACYSCSWVNDCFIHSWPDWSYYNAQNKFTTVETCAMIAPRALVVAMGDKDELFDSKLTEEECEKIKPYYDIFGKSNKFRYIIFNGVHEADKKDEELDFLLNSL